MGETVNKMAYKMEEGDPWFEEKTMQVWPGLRSGQTIVHLTTSGFQVEQMESQLKKLYLIVELVVGCRYGVRRNILIIQN